MTKERMNTRIDANLKAELKSRAATRRLPMNDLIESALYEYLNPDDYKTVSLEYLSRLEKRHALVLKRLDMTLEVLGKFILVWFMNTPDPQNSELKTAMGRSGLARYDKFLDKVTTSLDKNSVLHAFESRILDENDFTEDLL